MFDPSLTVHKSAAADACGFAPSAAARKTSPPPGPLLKIPGRVWAALIAGGVSIVGTVWAFSLTVSNDIREARTEIHAIHSLLKTQETRIERLEGVYIFPK